MDLPKHVKIVEVAPRDGLQNELIQVPTDVKLDFIRRLSEAGCTHIEATSFVSPNKIPQLADHKRVLKQLPKDSDVTYSVLVPNEQGMIEALEAGCEHVAIFTGCTDTFTQHNINCSIEDSFLRFEKVMELAKAHDIPVRGYLSCCLGCPYEGEVPLAQVATLAKRLIALGCYEISLGDTIGVGTPLKAQAMVEYVARDVPVTQLAAHFHDTYGQAVANIFAVLQSGIAVVDAAVTGLGGCPYANGAKGNVATEAVVYLCEGLGINTGINLEKLIEAGKFIRSKMQHE